MLRCSILTLVLLALLGCTPALRTAPPSPLAPWERVGAYIPGNAVEVLIDGSDTYQAMYDAIDAARDHIHLETYILCNDAIGREFTDRLVERRRAGVDVRLIYDDQGSHACTTADFFEGLERQGIELVAFRPPRGGPLIYPAYYNRRDHRKLLIVDGRVAFTGGINVNDVYAATPLLSRDDEQYWRDTNVRVEGPAVAAFQRLFLERWRSLRALPELPEHNFFPSLAARGAIAAKLLSSRGGAASNPIYQSYLDAIAHARERVWLTHAYLSPEPNLLSALIAAAERGVDVRLVLPSVSDLPMLKPMAQSSYRRLLEAGIRIYERQDAYMHAKTAVVDGIWTTIGSTNLDYRSLRHNDEVNIALLDPGIARHMEQVFHDDVALSTEIKLDQWRKRGPLARLKEWLSRLVAYWI